MSLPRSCRVAVIGGGVTGLTAAYRLATRHGLDGVVVLEAEPRVGGNIDTLARDGFLVEHGPNGFLDNVPETVALARDLGLTPLRSNDAARKRYLVKDGRLVRVPSGPLSFAFSPLLSVPGRLRVFAEPFARRRPVGDETVLAFAARRIGPEAAATLVDTMVKGVFAGEAEVLSLVSAFPKMAGMEARHGSLVRAMLAKMVARLAGRGAGGGGPAGPGGVLTSFEKGFVQLTDTLAARLGDAVITSAPVRDLAVREGRFVLALPGGEMTADKVLLAVPAPQAAVILDSALPAAAGLLRRTPAAPMTVVATAFERAAFPHPLDGFGFLVPQSERMRLMGTLWTTSIFPNRAPPDMILLRNMVGGLRDPRAVTLPAAVLEALVLEELRRLLGPVPDPVQVHVFRYLQGISQYPPGHAARLDALDTAMAAVPGLYAAGNSLRGISVNLCIVQAEAVAARIAEETGGRGRAGGN